MKVYIENYNINEIISKKDKFDKYYEKMYNRIDIFSPEGLFVIDKNSMYKLTNITDCVLKITDKIYNGITLIADDSTYNKVDVFQIPVNHIQANIFSLIYKINNTKTKMVIEGTCCNNHINVIDKYNGFTPTDLYFTDFGITEINVFLKSLN